MHLKPSPEKCQVDWLPRLPFYFHSQTNGISCHIFKSPYVLKEKADPDTEQLEYSKVPRPQMFVPEGNLSCGLFSPGQLQHHTPGTITVAHNVLRFNSGKVGPRQLQILGTRPGGATNSWLPLLVLLPPSTPLLRQRLNTHHRPFPSPISITHFHHPFPSPISITHFHRPLSSPISIAHCHRSLRAIEVDSDFIENGWKGAMK